MAFTLAKLRPRLIVVALTLLCSASVVNPQPLPVGTHRVAWVIFVDDLHLDFRNTGRIRALIQTVLNDLVLEGDLAAIRTSGPSAVLTNFSSRHELLPFIKKLTGGGLRAQEILTVRKQPGLIAHELRYRLIADEVRYRTRVSLSSAAAAAALLGGVDLNRRALLYISNGHPFDMSAFSEARALTNLAGANGVRIFAINGASLGTMPSLPVSDPAWNAYETAAPDSLRAIAEQGGGFAILDAQNVPAALQQVSNNIRQ